MVSKRVIWYAFGLLIAIIVLVIMFFIFPRSGCDNLAVTSANEIRAAIECAANDNIDPDTGLECKPTARVKFCQENRWSLFGSGFVQAYMGLMVPEYMIYYKEFPKDPVRGEGFSLQFSESYPFERSYVGQRPWDIRPTLTEFKEFYKTKYLEKPCTNENALCFNIRGREEVIRLNAPNIDDVRLRRKGCYPAEVGTTTGVAGLLVTAGGCIARDDPTFYMVAPCHSQIRFKREGSTVYAESIDFKSVKGNSNYCYATEDTLEGLIATYSAEIGCYAADFIADVLSGGTKAGAEWGAKTTAKAASKGTIAKAIAKASAKAVGKRLGVPTSRAAARIWLVTAGVVPCVDADWCRGLASCGEALMWPGMPFSEVTDGDFVGGKSYQTASEVFVECCTHMVYGAEKDPDAITCEEPEDKAALMKDELEMGSDDALYMSNLTNYLGIPDDRAEVLCSLTEGDLSKTCYDSMEAKARGYDQGDWCGYRNHTYDFDREVETSTISVSVRTFKYACKGDVMALISDDADNWEVIDERTMEKGKNAMNNYVLELPEPEHFQYLRLYDSNGCEFDYSAVVISPYAHDVISAVPGEVYELDPNRFNYFITPEGYSENAANLCARINFCDTISKTEAGEERPLKYFKDAGARTDFRIGQNERIGILTTGASLVEFGVSQ